MRARIAIAIVMLSVGAWPARAQAPAPSAALEDTLREFRILASACMTARTRQEVEAARELAARDKEIERLRAELAKQEKK